MKTIVRTLLVWTLVCNGWCALFKAAPPKDQYLSPANVVVSKTWREAYVAEATAKQVAVFDTATGKVRSQISVDGQPGGLALSPDGTKLYVTSLAPAGSVFEVDLAKGKTVRTFPAGHTPMAPVVSLDGTRLYVCNRYQNDVSVIDLASGKCIVRILASREPVAAAITPDGARLVVGCLLPWRTDKDPYPAARVVVIDTVRTNVMAQVLLPQGSMAVRGVCVSPDGKYAYVTHVLARFQVPTTQLERGWMNTSALSVLDLVSNTLVNTVLLDDVDSGAANPWGVACSRDGATLYVTHAGSHELSVIDRKALHEKLAKVAAGTAVSQVSLTADDVPNDLSFLVGLRQRLRLKGNGPREVAIAGNRAYIAEYFSDSLGVVQFASNMPAVVASAALGPRVPQTLQRKGEMLFNDASICFQQWQSCASCHPDSRVDGLNWDLLNDGIGNPKQTKSMLLTHKTPPTMISGIRERAETAVRSGIKFILFAVRPDGDAMAIDAYLSSMTPVPSPWLVNGKLSSSAARGKKLFEANGCVECHPPPLYTDLKSYDVGVGTGNDKGRPFDTPTLVEVWRTAPYLYDGRAHTMKEVFKQFNTGDKHGSTSQLSDKELDDLVAYVMSL